VKYHRRTFFHADGQRFGRIAAIQLVSDYIWWLLGSGYVSWVPAGSGELAVPVRLRARSLEEETETILSNVDVSSRGYGLCSPSFFAGGGIFRACRRPCEPFWFDLGCWSRLSGPQPCTPKHRYGARTIPRKTSTRQSVSD
jgi:hypothetical protein